ncbi:MAG TPA: hypothetical protein VFO79_02265 [Xanthomonadales bacterium]|nr:hypothetical protein [Xanthomonadales bacterium]
MLPVASLVCAVAIGGSAKGALPDVIFSNGFDDVQLIETSTGMIAVGEGQAAGFGVRLALAPIGSVTVSVVSGDPGKVTVSPATLEFSPADYATFQDVNASALDDPDAADENVTLTLASPGLASRLVTMNVDDDEPPGTESVDVAAPFPLPVDDPAVQVDGVGRNAFGELVRDPSAFANGTLWIPNDREGTVSKIDVATGAELARYATVTHAPGRVVDHVGRGFPAWNADLNGNAQADNRPQYAAIDYAGDVWVANVAHDFNGLQSTVTKIRGNAATCPDLDGNQLVDTSRPVNGTPGIQLNDPAEFLGEADECIAMTVVVGALGTGTGGIRALAIDANRSAGGSDAGNPWVGVGSEPAFYQLHGRTGVIMQRVATPQVRAYTAAIDSLGRLWARDFCCGTVILGRIDTTQNPAPFALIATVPIFTGLGYGNYAVAVDLANRVWVAGFPYGGLMRYEPGPGTWTQASIPGFLATGQARGVAVDGRGNVWTSFHPDGADGLVARFDADTAASTGSYQLDDSSGGAANIPIGVGIDVAGNVWTSNQATSNISRLHIDPVTGEPAPHPVTGDVVDTFAVGPGPYVHSDFTGLAYRRVTRPDGEYRVRLPPCAGSQAAHWQTVEWNATTPAGTRIELWVRTGNDAATLAQAPLQGPWSASPADLQSTPGPVGDSVLLQLTLRLVSEDPAASATLHSYRVTRVCSAA